MKRTLAELPPKVSTRIERLEKLMDSAHSSKAYRHFIHNAKGPCVPSLAVSLKDITFLMEGNPDFLDEQRTIINFSKRRNLYKIINELQRYQQQYVAPAPERALLRSPSVLAARSALQYVYLPACARGRQPPVWRFCAHDGGG